MVTACYNPNANKLPSVCKNMAERKTYGNFHRARLITAAALALTGGLIAGCRENESPVRVERLPTPPPTSQVISPETITATPEITQVPFTPTPTPVDIPNLPPDSKSGPGAEGTVKPKQTPEVPATPSVTPVATEQPISDPTASATPETTPETTPQASPTPEKTPPPSTATPEPTNTPEVTTTPNPTPTPEATPVDECEVWPSEIVAIMDALDIKDRPCLQIYETKEDLPKWLVPSANYLPPAFNNPNSPDGSVVVIVGWITKSNEGRLYSEAHEIFHFWQRQEKAKYGVQKWIDTPAGKAYTEALNWEQLPSGEWKTPTDEIVPEDWPTEPAANTAADWFNPSNEDLSGYWQRHPQLYEWAQKWLPTPP